MTPQKSDSGNTKAVLRNRELSPHQKLVAQIVLQAAKDADGRASLKNNLRLSKDAFCEERNRLKINAQEWLASPSTDPGSFLWCKQFVGDCG